MKIALVHGEYPRRDVVARGLHFKLQAEVTVFSCCENLLASSMDYDVFVIYSNFGRKMSGVQGVARVRSLAPHAFIVGVSPTPYSDRKFLPAGADAFLLLAGNEIAELSDIIGRHGGA